MQKALDELANIYELISEDVPAAESAMKKFNARHKPAAGSFVAAKARLTQLIVDAFMQLNNADTTDAESLLAYFEKHKKYDEAAALLVNMARINFRQSGRYKEGERYLDYIGKNLADKISGQTEISYLILLTYVAEKKNENAQKMHIAVEALGKLKLITEKNATWYRHYISIGTVIANLYTFMGYSDEAWKYLQECLQIIEENTLSHYTRITVLQQVARYHSLKGDNENCAASYEKVLAIMKQFETPPILLLLCNVSLSEANYGMYLHTPVSQAARQKELLNKISAYIKEADKIIEQHKMGGAQEYLSLAKCRLAYLNKQYAKAIKILNDAMPEQKRREVDMLNYDYHEMSHKIYYEWGTAEHDFKKLEMAYEHLDKFSNLLDNKSKKTTRDKIDLVNTTHELQQKKLNEQILQLQLDTLKTEAKMTSFSLHEKITVLDELKTFIKGNDRKEPSVREFCKLLIRKIEAVKITEHEKNQLQQKLIDANRVMNKVLIERFPSLSNNEIDMCGKFKTGMTNKELVKIYGQSEKSYELQRYRLKKKMNLGRGDNLVKFLKSLDNA